MRSVRKNDYVFRRGGDEFVVFLPGITQEMAHPLAQRIRKRIESTRIAVESGPAITITCSLGIAEYQENDSNLESTVKRADEALYHTKNTKRNSVTLWSL